MRCKDCSKVRGYPYKRSHLVALWPTKITLAIHRRRGGRANGERAGRQEWDAQKKLYRS